MRVQIGPEGYARVVTAHGPAMSAGTGLRPAEAAVAPVHRRVSPGTVLRVALRAGAGGGVALAVTLMLIAEIANRPTAVAGVDSSTWTAITAVSALVFGRGAFHADFAVGPIAFGLLALVAYAVLFATLGIALLAYMQGARPGALGSALHGLAFALFAEVLVVNLLVNSSQGTPIVYESLPPWGWWAAHAAYGVVLGLLGARLLARAGEGSP